MPQQIKLSLSVCFLVSLLTPRVEAGSTAGVGGAIEQLGGRVQRDPHATPPGLAVTIRDVRLRNDDLSALDGLGDITRLDLRNSDVRDADLKHVARLGRLETLVLGQDEARGEFRDAIVGPEGLGYLKALRHLKTLDLSGIVLSRKCLAVIADLESLEDLDLSRTGVSDGTLQFLELLRRLKSLRLAGTDVTNDGAVALGNISQLRNLDLGSTHVSDLSGLQYLTRLETLGLHDVGVSDSGLTGLLALRGLRSLDLSRTCSAREGASVLPGLPVLRELCLGNITDMEGQLQALRNMRQLRRLRLVDAEMNDAAFASLAQLAARSKLDVEIDRISTERGVSDAGISHLAEIKHLTILHLDLTCGAVTTRGLGRLAGLRIRSIELRGRPMVGGEALRTLRSVVGLEELSLESNAAIDDAVLENLKGLAGLRLLDLTGTKVTGAGLVRLRDLPCLEDLRLGKCNCAGPGLSALSSLPKLKWLDLSGSHAGDVELAGLEHLPAVQWLDLSNNPLSDAGLVRLAGLPNLQTLILRKTLVAGSGLAHLAGLPRLRRLDVSQTKIGDAEAARLASLEHIEELIVGYHIGDAGLDRLAPLRRLRHLQIAGSRITDKSIGTIESFARLSYLGIEPLETHITRVGMARLEAEMPNCRVAVKQLHFEPALSRGESR